MRLIANRPLSISPTAKVRIHEEFEMQDEIVVDRYLRRGDARLAEGPQPKPKKAAKRKAAPRTKRAAKPKPETSDLPVIEPERPTEPAE